MSHPLTDLFRRVPYGRFPPSDGRVEVVPSPPGRTDAVIALVGHTVVAADVDPAEVLEHLPPSSLSAPMKPPFLSWLAARLRTEAGGLDLVLVASGGAEATEGLVAAPDLDHPRVRRATRYRTEAQAFATRDGTGLVTIGRGLAGRLEVAIEVSPERRGVGMGRLLAAEARTLVRGDEFLYAQVSPGNAASVRAFLAAGFEPVGSEVLFLKREG